MLTEKELTNRLQEIIADISRDGLLAKGKNELLRFCNNVQLTPRESILAHCYQCLGYYNGMEGERDCYNPVCPLYPYMPYSSQKAKPTRTVSLEVIAKMRSAKLKTGSSGKHQQTIKGKISTISAQGV